jgi:RNase P subunit RPR2
MNDLTAICKSAADTEKRVAILERVINLFMDDTTCRSVVKRDGEWCQRVTCPKCSEPYWVPVLPEKNMLAMKCQKCGHEWRFEQ